MHLQDLLDNSSKAVRAPLAKDELPVSLGPEYFANPQFGKSLLKEFMIDQDLIFLTSLKNVAPRVGANPDDIAFILNATTGINTVLNSLKFEPGDKIIALQVIYQSIGFSIERTEAKTGAKMVKIPVQIPVDMEKVLKDFEDAIDEKTKLLVIDHVNSPYAFVIPIERFAAIAHKHNILVLVDGAHAVGQLPLNMSTLGADFYTGNFHKWGLCPAGCSFLWASPKHKDLIFPNVISHGFKDEFTARFLWTGTQDYCPYLAVNASFEIMDRLGGHDKVMKHNNDLAKEAAYMLKDAWKTELSSTGNVEHASMYSIRVPPFTTEMAKKPLKEQAIFLADTLMEKYKIEMPVIAGVDALWARISAQIYNEISDYHILRDGVLDILANSH